MQEAEPCTIVPSLLAPTSEIGPGSVALETEFVDPTEEKRLLSSVTTVLLGKRKSFAINVYLPSSDGRGER